jgi:hypothetical protein
LNNSGSVLEASFELCPHCDERLYDAVKYCPYCGAEASAAKQPVADVPPANAPMTPLPAPVTVAPAPVPEAAAVKPTKQVVSEILVVEPVSVPIAPPSGSRAVTAEIDVPPQMPPPPRSKTGIVVALGLAALVGAYLINKPSKKDDACDHALNQAAALLAGGDAASARGKTVQAIVSCSGEANVRAGELQSAADKVIAAQANCERSFRRISSQITERRLQSARSTLDQLDTLCVNSLQGKGLRSQIETGQAIATVAEVQMRKQLAEGDFKAARAAFDQIIANNREHPDLSGLRQELAASVKAPNRGQPMIAPVATTSTETAPRDQQRGGRRELPQTARSQPTLVSVPASPPNPQADLAQTFLRDAEAAMNQFKFDAAKTFVESARRIDPGNPQVATLARRIKERELHYLKEETSIK